MRLFDNGRGYMFSFGLAMAAYQDESRNATVWAVFMAVSFIAAVYRIYFIGDEHI